MDITMEDYQGFCVMERDFRIQNGIENYDEYMDASMEGMEYPGTVDVDNMSMEAISKESSMIYHNAPKYVDTIGKDVAYLHRYDPELKIVTNAEKIKKGDNTVYTRLLKHEDILDEKSVKNGIRQYLVDFLGANMSNLSVRGPTARVIFSNATRAKLFDVSKVSESTVKDAINASKTITSTWKTAAEPVNILMAWEISHYLRFMTKEESKEDPPKRMAYIVALILGLRFYSWFQMRYMPYTPDENLMASVIDNLHERYLIKHFRNVYDLVAFISYSNVDYMCDLLVKNLDFTYCYFLNNLSSRFNSIMKGIMRAYMAAYNEGKRSRSESIKKTDQEDDSTYVESTENDSADIEQLVRRLSMKMAQSADVDEYCLRASCRSTTVVYEKMRATLNNVRDKELDMLSLLMRDIIQYYVVSLKKDIKTIKSAAFITIMKKSYSISNTVDANIIEIKKTLDELLKKYHADFAKTNRVATISNLRTCIYLYCVYFIAKTVK